MKVSLLPDGKHVVSADDNAKFVVWNLVGGKPIREVELGHPITELIALPGGMLLFGLEDGRLVWWQWSQDKPSLVVQAHTEGWVCSLSVAAGKALTSGDRTAKVWDVRNGEMLCCFEGHSDRVHASCFVGEQFAASGSRNATVRIWSVHSAQQIDSFGDAPAGRRKYQPISTIPMSSNASHPLRTPSSPLRLQAVCTSFDTTTANSFDDSHSTETGLDGVGVA